MSHEECSGAAAGGAAAAAALLTLDPEEHNSPEWKIEMLPAKSGGWFHPTDGKAKRIEALQKFELLAGMGKRCVFLALTIDRSKREGPREGYDYSSKRVSKLLSERLGLTLWGRVAEVQSKTGDGWVHWHVVAVVDDTRWMRADGWVDLKGLATRCWEVWRDEFGIGGVNVQLAKSGAGVAGYMAGYLTKGWPAIPTWLGESTRRMRVVGFSKEASRRIRELLDLPAQPRRPKRPRSLRSARTLFERLAGSGLSSKAVLRWVDTRTGEARTTYLGTLPVPADLATAVAWQLGTPVIEREERWGKARMVYRCIPVGSPREFIEHMRRRADDRGLTEATDREYQRRLLGWRKTWDRMQCER